MFRPPSGSLTNEYVIASRVATVFKRSHMVGHEDEYLIQGKDCYCSTGPRL